MGCGGTRRRSFVAGTHGVKSVDDRLGSAMKLKPVRVFDGENRSKYHSKTLWLRWEPTVLKTQKAELRKREAGRAGDTAGWLRGGPWKQEGKSFNDRSHHGIGRSGKLSRGVSHGLGSFKVW